MILLGVHMVQLKRELQNLIDINTVIDIGMAGFMPIPKTTLESVEQQGGYHQ